MHNRFNIFRFHCKDLSLFGPRCKFYKNRIETKKLQKTPIIQYLTKILSLIPLNIEWEPKSFLFAFWFCVFVFACQGIDRTSVFGGTKLIISLKNVKVGVLGEESLTFLTPSALEVSNHGGWKKSLRCPFSLADRWRTHLLHFIQTVAFNVSQSQFNGFHLKNLFVCFSFKETSILIKIKKVALQLTGSVSSIMLT